MGTKYRRDLTAEDFRVLMRFKHHLLRLKINEKIRLGEWAAPTAYEQNWYLSGAGWKENKKKERKNEPCYVLVMRDFRAVIRAIALDIDTVSEGLVIETLKRFSLIRFTKEGHWKWQTKDGHPCLILEKQRLSPEGTIKKRNPGTPRAQLDEYWQKVRKTMDELHWDAAQAVQFHSGWGWTEEVRQDLERQAKEAESNRVKHRAEIDGRIKERQKKR